MKTTRERLYMACSLYSERLRGNVAAQMRHYPSVRHGSTVSVKYFKAAEFIAKNNKLKITFLQRTYAVKILRYIQRNYVKYPEYSAPYVKSEKDVMVNVELTPETVDKNLYNNTDSDVSENADIILTTIAIVEYLPLKLQNVLINYIHERALETIKKEIAGKEDSAKNEVNSLLYRIDNIEAKIKNKIAARKDLDDIIINLNSSIIHIAFKKDNIFAHFVSFGLLSKTSKIKRIRKKICKLETKRDLMVTQIFEDAKVLNKMKDDYCESLYKYKKTVAKIKHIKAVEQAQFDFDKSNVSFPYSENKIIKDPVIDSVSKGTPKYFTVQEDEQEIDCSNVFKFEEIQSFKYEKYIGLSIKGVILLKDEDNRLYLLISNDLGKDVERIVKSCSENEQLLKICCCIANTENKLQELYKDFVDKISFKYYE